MHGMPVTGGRGFRGLKPLWYNGVRLKWVPTFLFAVLGRTPPLFTSCSGRFQSCNSPFIDKVSLKLGYHPEMCEIIR